MLKELLPAFVGALVRALIQAATGAGVIVAPDVEAKITLGLVFLITLSWSWFQKWRKNRNPPFGAIAIIVAASLSLSSCAGVTKNDCLKRAAAAEVAITEGYNTTYKLVSSGVLSKKNGHKAMDALDAANAATNSATGLCYIDQKTASAYLLTASTALVEFTTITKGE